MQDESALLSAGHRLLAEPASKLRLTRALVLAFSLAGLAASGCGSEKTPLSTDKGAVGDNDEDDDDGKWCAALEVLRTECQECHSKNVVSTAPMPLDTYKDLLEPGTTDDGKKVYELVAERIHDKKSPMPEPPRKLSEAQLAALDAWIEAGALPGADPTCKKSQDSDDEDDEGDGDDETGDGDDATGDGDSDDDDIDGGTGGDGDGDEVSSEWPSECEEIHRIVANDNGQPHAVGANTQTHPQFYFDAPWGDEAVQALAFKPITDNPKVLHHWILYENGSQGASNVGGLFLTGWSPGKDGMRTFPDDIGVYLPSGSDVLRLDTHYYNMGSGSKAEKDSSGVEICIVHKDKFRKNTASTHAFGTVAFSIANGEDKKLKVNCNVTTTGGSAYLLNSSPHMHKLGYHAKFARTRGGTQMMLQDTPFNFEFQEGKSLDRVELKTGDSMLTECDFMNDTGATVRFGQDTEDEMCFNFAMYYPMGALKCANVGTIGGL